MRRVRVRVVHLLLAVVVGLGVCPAAYGAPDGTGNSHRIPDVLTPTAPALHPEGVTYDPTRHAFLVSSLRKGTVSVARPDGSVQTLIQDDRMVSTLGVHVDVARQRVLVAYADLGVGERSTPETTQKLSGLGIFDLRTGQPRKFVDLAAVAGPGLHAANDLAIAPDGTAYVTDPLSDALLSVDVSGRAAVVVRDVRFHDPAQPTSFGLNGIVWHPDGYLLAVKSWGGELFRITPRPHPEVHQVALDQPIFNGDGLLLRRRGALVAVTNPLGPDGISAVRLLRSRDRWTSATTPALQTWADPAPTTLTATPCGDYVLDGRLDVLFSGGLADNFSLRRIAFRRRRAGRAQPS